MYDLISKFFAFFFPILKQVVLEVAVQSGHQSLQGLQAFVRRQPRQGEVHP